MKKLIFSTIIFVAPFMWGTIPTNAAVCAVALIEGRNSWMREEGPHEVQSRLHNLRVTDLGQIDAVVAYPTGMIGSEIGSHGLSVSAAGNRILGIEKFEASSSEGDQIQTTKTIKLSGDAALEFIENLSVKSQEHTVSFLRRSIVFDLVYDFLFVNGVSQFEGVHFGNIGWTWWAMLFAGSRAVQYPFHLDYRFLSQIGAIRHLFANQVEGAWILLAKNKIFLTDILEQIVNGAFDSDNEIHGKNIVLQQDNDTNSILSRAFLRVLNSAAAKATRDRSWVGIDLFAQIQDGVPELMVVYRTRKKSPPVPETQNEDEESGVGDLAPAEAP